MVRHLRVANIQHSNAPTSSAVPASSLFPQFSIRIPPPSLFTPSASETTANAAAVSERIPGFKTSAAFLRSLRANLHLSSALLDPSYDPRFTSSAAPSLSNTPDLGPTTMTSSTGSLLPPPSPSPEATLAAVSTPDPLANIPPLTTHPATSEEDKIAGLRLIADSVAQQRQYQSRQLIFHPLTIALWVAVLAVVSQYLYKGKSGDLLLVGTTTAGLISAGLLAVRLITASYLEIAEQVGTWKWFGKDSDMIITKFGDDVIGAIIIQITRSDSNITNPSDTSTSNSPTSSPTTPNRSNAARNRKSNSSSSSSNKPRGLIRAWTVLRKYRGKGVGGGLLEEAVRHCKAKGVNPTMMSSIEFADDHANSARVGPQNGKNAIWTSLGFNSAMDRKEEKARSMLDTIVGEGMSEKERRRRERRGT